MEFSKLEIFPDKGWELYRVDTIADGNCLFHAICASTIKTYLAGQLQDKIEIVNRLRRELADALIQPDDKGVNLYNKLGDGQLETFAQAVPEYSVENMYQTLRSNQFIGHGYFELIARVINRDIYVINSKHHDLFIGGDFDLSIKGNRRSIIIYYIDKDPISHYELIVLKENNEFLSNFKSDHPLIKFLYSKLLR